MVYLEIIDLAESIPYTLVDAMRDGEVNVVRGLQALSGAILWQDTNPPIYLVALIAKSRRQDQDIYSGELAALMHSSREREIVTDFVEWGLLEHHIDDELNESWVIPKKVWDTCLDSLDEAAPDMGLESMGRLLGICSLAKHADHRRVGKGYYTSVKAVAVRARNLNQDGAIGEEEAAQVFGLSCSDSERKWWALVGKDKQKVASLRFFSDMTGDLWVVNRDVIVAMERIIGRTNELLRERGIT